MPPVEVDINDPYGEKYIEEMMKLLGKEKPTEVSIATIVSRDEWEALPPKETKALVRPILTTVFTHTGMEECYSREDCISWLQKRQMEDMEEKELADIQFNFYIGGDGTIYEGRGWDYDADKEDHNADIDGLSVDIAYIGNFENKELSNELIQIGCDLAIFGRALGYLHHNFNITTYWEDHVEIMRPKYKYNPIDDPHRIQELRPNNEMGHPCTRTH